MIYSFSRGAAHLRPTCRVIYWVSVPGCIPNSQTHSRRDGATFHRGPTRPSMPALDFHIGHTVNLAGVMIYIIQVSFVFIQDPDPRPEWNRERLQSFLPAAGQGLKDPKKNPGRCHRGYIIHPLVPGRITGDNSTRMLPAETIRNVGAHMNPGEPPRFSEYSDDAHI